MGYAEAAAGHKAKGQFTLDMQGAEITTYEELESLDVSFHYQIPNSYDYAYTDTVTVDF